MWRVGYYETRILVVKGVVHVRVVSVEILGRNSSCEDGKMFRSNRIQVNNTVTLYCRVKQKQGRR